MKKKVKVFFFLIVSMVITGSTIGAGVTSYYELEEKISSITEFDSNGVRFEYVSSKNLKEEKERIKEIYKKSYTIEEEENSIRAIGEVEIEVNLRTQGEKTYVNLTINNESKVYTSLEIKEEVLKVDSKENTNKKLFEFYKGKVLEKNKEELLRQMKENESNNLEIENGYTWKSKVGKEIVNFGLVNYDTGLHLIIGTPVIFTTY